MSQFKRITVARLKELFAYWKTQGKTPSITIQKKDGTTKLFNDVANRKDGEVEILTTGNGIYTGRYVDKSTTAAPTANHPDADLAATTPSAPTDANKSRTETLPTYRLSSIDEAQALALLATVTSGQAKLTRKKGYIAIKQDNVQQHVLMKDAITQYLNFTHTNPAIIA